ncbi:TetR/AcrR family transcriptional regulator [Nocardia sp. NBC_01377]|uniref:TetR/AcrR family transcriptional regulator n=1 Tax=Nocardia sp. NBC_01377 TaxID=2903595 RepID=UPI003247A046
MRSTVDARDRAYSDRDGTYRALLNSATTLFLTLGYEQTGLARISTHAGHSEDTVRGYYTSKNDIGHDVADHLCHHALQRLHRTRPDDNAELVTVLSRWARIAIHRPGWLRLELALAAHDGDAPLQYSLRLSRIRTALTHLLTATIPAAPGADNHQVTADFLLTMVAGLTTLHPGDAHPDHLQISTQIELVLRGATN